MQFKEECIEKLVDYKPKMNLKETQVAIKFIKDTFQTLLSKKLNLLRVSAPLFVKTGSGLNDGLNGVEKPIQFEANGIGESIEIVHSLAKWKRMALRKYNLNIGEGLYTDMNAIRKDEVLDYCHSLYVDQWDWEKAINKEDRSLSFLKKEVKKVYSCIYKLSQIVSKKYPCIRLNLPKQITFISTKKVESLYPELSRKERENKICQTYGAVFLFQIGYPLKDGKPHDGRAADYDDWKLNGDILVFDEVHNSALELSSMGIRVDSLSLQKQLKFKNEEYKLANFYCKSIINDEFPFCIGGGIGQSRLCMFMLNKAHIGEVQASVWNDDYLSYLKEKNLYLL